MEKLQSGDFWSHSNSLVRRSGYRLLGERGWATARCELTTATVPSPNPLPVIQPPPTIIPHTTLKITLVVVIWEKYRAPYDCHPKINKHRAFVKLGYFLILLSNAVYGHAVHLVFLPFPPITIPNYHAPAHLPSSSCYLPFSSFRPLHQMASHLPSLRSAPLLKIATNELPIILLFTFLTE